jgi:hypothetical protein
MADSKEGQEGRQVNDANDPSKNTFQSIPHARCPLAKICSPAQL